MSEKGNITTAGGAGMTQSIERRVVEPLIPFKGLMGDHLQQLLDESEMLYLFPGYKLVDAGQYDGSHYYLLNGTLAAQDAQGDVAEHFYDTRLTPIMDQQPRPKSVVAVTQATVLKVDRERLDQLLTWSQTAEYLMIELASQRSRDEDAAWLGTILKSNLFLKVPPINVGKILQKVETMMVDSGDVLIRQGEIGDGCYFIKEGIADVTRATSEVDEAEHVATISEGRCFGEDALLQDAVRNANVIMRTDGVLLTLSKLNFLELLRAPQLPVKPWSEVESLLETELVVDVRTEEEYAEGHLTGAINVPLNLLALKGRIIKTVGSCLIYCDTGRRSATAARLLSDTGIEACALENGIRGLDAANLISRWTKDDYVYRDGRVVKGQ